MRRSIQIIIILSFFITSCSAKDKNKNARKVDSLNVIEINNSKIYPILDSIIDHEKKCEYYSSDLIFSIISNSSNSNLIIGSIGTKLFKNSNIIGCFEYGHHLFIVKGTILESSLFRKIKQNRLLTFETPQSNQIDKEGVLVFSSDDVQDDSYSYWYYLYKNENFTFLSSHYCGK